MCEPGPQNSHKGQFYKIEIYTLQKLHFDIFNAGHLQNISRNMIFT